MNYSELVAKTSFGLEEVLAEEIKNLGGTDIKILNRAVSFKGNKELLYRANMNLRTALRILLPIHEFTFNSQELYYKEINKFVWDDFLNADQTLSIDSFVNSDIFSHSGYVTRLTKDAIVDKFRDKYGRRPSVSLDDPDLRINIHISGNHCTVSLDSSGSPLFKRGYRMNNHEAPLNEVLAAGMILLSDWSPDKIFVDPMCGSGTLPIEAALIAKGIPPGIFRDKFGFMGWNDFDNEMFNRIKSYRAVNLDLVKIFGSDINPVYTRFSKVNAKSAGVADDLKIYTKVFENLEPPSDSGILIINPPYGERLKDDEINQFYSMIGSTLKHKWAGFNVWILSSNMEALKFIGLKPSKKITLFNGQLECRFLKYELYSGSKKQKIAGL